MTHFEYIAVAFSIVLSLAAVRLLSGLSVAFVGGRRYLPHAMWIVFALLASALVWWNFWSFRHAQWNFLAFLLVLTVPAMIYLLAAALVPEQPAAVTSWREHFYVARVRVFVALGAFFVLVIGVTWLIAGLPLRHPMRIVQAIALGLAIVGGTVADPRLHRVLPFVYLGLLLIAATVLFFQPDAALVVADTN